MKAQIEGGKANYGGHAPAVRVRLNTGSILDVATGTYIEGLNGEWILNGGLPNIIGIVARPNMFKTTLLMMMVSKAYHYYGGSISIYDSDNSSEYGRFDHLHEQVTGSETSLIASGDLQIIDSSVMYGEEYHHATRGELKRIGSLKDNSFPTPFPDIDGKFINVKVPMFNCIDTLTAFPIETITDKQEDHLAGDAKRNMEDMTKGKVKSQIVSEIPSLAARYGGRYIITAQLRDMVALDPHAPPKKRLSTLRADVNIAGVPQVYYEQTNQLLCIISANPLLNDKTGEPDYPSQKLGMALGKTKKTAKDRDLTEIEISVLRGKSGMSGIPIYLVGTQTDGIDIHLSRWHYMRTYIDETTKKPYGVDGSNVAWFLDIYPKVKFSRVTVRDTIDDDDLLKRALEITCDIHQLYYMMRAFPRELLCTPKELYDDITKMGYSWDKILSETRGVWLFGDGNLKTMNPDDKWPLTTADLLRMRAGLYTPYWLEKAKWDKPKPVAKPIEITSVAEEA